MGKNFHIEIISQGWMTSDSPTAPCSSGHVYLQIGGKEILSREETYIDEIPFGISDSALALLRTLVSDHTPGKPVANRLIFHSCSTLLMFACPIGVNWTVERRGNKVNINQVTRYPSTDEKDAVKFQDLAIDCPYPEYKEQVVNFALKAKQLFTESPPKQPYDEWHKKQYDKFWLEFNNILDQVEAGQSDR